MTSLRRIPQSLLILAFFAGISAQAWVNLRLRALDASVVPLGEDFRRKWDPRIFKMLTFGHLPAAIDWHWIEAQTDPAMSRLPKGIHPSFYYVIDFVTDLDPAFFQAYFAGANILSVVRDDGEGARDILLKAKKFAREDLGGYPEEFRERYWSQRWNLSALLAYVYLFDLNDMPRAAAEFEEAALLPNAPEYLGRLSQRLQKPDGQYEVAERLVGFLLSQNKDARAIERLEKQQYSLRVSHFVFNLNRGYREFQARTRRPGGRESFLAFLRESRTPLEDPWGGAISLSDDGKIQTSTPHVRAFGLE